MLLAARPNASQLAGAQQSQGPAAHPVPVFHGVSGVCVCVCVSVYVCVRVCVCVCVWCVHVSVPITKALAFFYRACLQLWCQAGYMQTHCWLTQCMGS